MQTKQKIYFKFGMLKILIIFVSIIFLGIFSCVYCIQIILYIKRRFIVPC